MYPYIPELSERYTFGLIYFVIESFLYHPVPVSLMTISVGILSFAHQAPFFCVSEFIVSAGIVITDAVTTVAIEMVHWTNHQVKGTMRIPRASFGSMTL